MYVLYFYKINIILKYKNIFIKIIKLLFLNKNIRLNRDSRVIYFII